MFEPNFLVINNPIELFSNERSSLTASNVKLDGSIPTEGLVPNMDKNIKRLKAQFFPSEDKIDITLRIDLDSVANIAFPNTAYFLLTKNEKDIALLIYKKLPDNINDLLSEHGELVNKDNCNFTFQEHSKVSETLEFSPKDQYIEVRWSAGLLTKEEISAKEYSLSTGSHTQITVLNALAKRIRLIANTMNNH